MLSNIISYWHTAVTEAAALVMGSELLKLAKIIAIFHPDLQKTPQNVTKSSYASFTFLDDLEHIPEKEVKNFS